MRRSMATAMAVALGLSTVAVASPALANPQGCVQGVPAFSQSSGYMNANNDAVCQTSVTRTFRVEIKRNVTGLPDPVVSSFDDYYTGTYYYASTYSCDGGRTAKYYGRSFFPSNPTYKDTSSVTVTTC